MIHKKRNWRILSLMFLIPAIIQANAQNTLSLAANLMQPGDSVTKERVEYVYSGEGGENAVWDFSNLDPENTYYIKYDTISDSQLVGYDMQKTYNYRFTNDSLLMTGYESPLLSVEYQQPLLIQSFPLKFGQTYSADYQGEGRYCGTHFERDFGSVKITADAIGTLILSEKDTLPNTLRVYTINTEAIRLNRDSCRNDSDNMKLVITEQYQWYAHGYRYPVFETMTSSSYNNTEHVATQQMAYRCLPEIQMELNDSISDRIRQEARFTVDRTAFSGESSKTSQNNDAGFTYDLIVNGKTVTITYNIEHTATIRVLIVDIMGNIYQNIQQTNPEGYNYSVSIDCSSLRRGQYIAYINVNGNIYNKKFPIK